MGMRKKKKVDARPQKVNMYKKAGETGGIEIKVGYAAAAAAGISGDAAVSCGLPGGSRALILSDGMGKGIKAAAGSRLVVRRLRRNLKAGMPVAQAIKEVNRYMIEQAESAAAKLSAGTDFASTQSSGQADRAAVECAAQGCGFGEDFATVDLTVIDRKSRRARFYKMGAATSFIMRGGRVRKIKGAALPVGIIPTLRLTHISAVLKEGDLILMRTGKTLRQSGFASIFPKRFIPRTLMHKAVRPDILPPKFCSRPWQGTV